jgi:NAD(P)-dependent dehydrogenase (short-subunit alcohol dehydrogenase family)
MTEATGGRLAGEGALVTGAAAGIGAAIARRLAAEGAHVVVHDRVLADAEVIVDAIRAAGGRAEPLAGDLADPAVPEALAGLAVEALGRVDILVNNAALKTRSRLETTDAAMFDQLMAVNLRAPLLMIRALLEHFRAEGGGTVLNIGSVNAHCGAADLLAYSMSKGGLTTLTRNLADALATEAIRVNQLNLGWILTPSEDVLHRAAGFPEGWADRLDAALAPSGALLDPEDVAHYVLAFVERSAHRVSGSVVDLEQYPMIGRNPPKASGR